MTEAQLVNKIDKTSFAIVAKIIDEFTIIINKGTIDGVRNEERVLIYAESDEEIIDPQSKASLGILEIVRGTGKVVHAQERLSTVKSDMKGASRTRTHNWLQWETWVESGPLIPFDAPKIGDKVKRIR